MATASRSYSRTRLAIGALLAAAAGSSAAFILLRLIQGDFDSFDLASIASIMLIGLLFGMALHFPAMVALILALILISGYAPGLLRRELTLTVILSAIGAIAGMGMALIITGYFGSSAAVRTQDGTSFPAYAAASMAVGGIILGVMISRGSNRLALRR